MGKTDVRTPRQLQAAMVENKQLDHLKQPSQSDDFVLINVRDTHDDVYDNSKGAPTHSHIEFDQFHFLPPVQAAATEEEIERDGIQSRRIWQSPNSFPEPIFNNQIPQFNHRAGNIEHGLDHSRVTHEIPVLFTNKYTSCMNLLINEAKTPERNKKTSSPVLECDLDCSSLSYFGQTLEQSRNDPWVMTSSSSPTHSTFTEIDDILDEEQVQESFNFSLKTIYYLLERTGLLKI